jgi:hypothetical protein
MDVSNRKDKFVNIYQDTKVVQTSTSYVYSCRKAYVGQVKVYLEADLLSYQNVSKWRKNNIFLLFIDWSYMTGNVASPYRSFDYVPNVKILLLLFAGFWTQCVEETGELYKGS